MAVFTIGRYLLSISTSTFFMKRPVIQQTDRDRQNRVVSEQLTFIRSYFGPEMPCILARLCSLDANESTSIF